MIAHPLILGAMAMDLCALSAVGVSAWIAFQVRLNWQPASAAAGQLRLESRAETASSAGRIGLAFYVAATAVLLVAVTTVLPSWVPGAMCGTGVLQATGIQGTRAVGYRLAAGGALYCWTSLDGLNRRHPLVPITRAASALMLVALPLVILAAWGTWSALSAIDTHRPVDCCMMIYDRFATLSDARHTAGLPNSWWTGVFAAVSAALVIAGGAVRRRPGGVKVAALAAVAMAWAPSALLALTRSVSPYIYGVLHHHCPWCLFTGSGSWLGYPLAIMAAVVLLESAAAVVVWWTCARETRLEAAASRRVATAGMRAAMAAAAFCVICAVPVVWWYWRWGVWITAAN